MISTAAAAAAGWGNALVVPQNTQQVSSAVAFYYNKTKVGQPVTMRTSRPRFHSSSHFVCPNTPLKINGHLPQDIKTPISVGIMQEKLNKVSAVVSLNFAEQNNARESGVCPLYPVSEAHLPCQMPVRILDMLRVWALFGCGLRHDTTYCCVLAQPWIYPGLLSMGWRALDLFVAAPVTEHA